MNQTEAIQYHLNSFNRYMESECPSIRLLRPYRDEANRAFRWRLAQQLKAWRYAGKIALPVYDEASGIYVHSFEPLAKGKS